MRITFGIIANYFDKVICQSFWALRITFGRLQITFGRLRITFQMDSPKNLFCNHPFFRQIYPFLDNSYIYWSKNANKLRILIRNMRINLKSDSQFLSEDPKMTNHFRFLNPAL